MAKVYFIYKTTNLVNGRFYIGKKISEAQKGEKGNMYGKPAHNKGIPMSEEQKAKLREAKAKLAPEKKHEIAMAAVRARKSYVCPVCGREIRGGSNYNRHFNSHK